MLCLLADYEGKSNVRKRVEKEKANGMKLTCDIFVTLKCTFFYSLLHVDHVSDRQWVGASLRVLDIKSRGPGYNFLLGHSLSSGCGCYLDR